MRDNTTDTGIIDQHIEMTPSGDRLLHKPDSIGIHRQVCLNICRHFKFIDQLTPGLSRTPRVQDNRESVLRQSASNRGANSRRGARHESHGAFHHLNAPLVGLK
jgi:hypothetical protein